MPRGLPNVPRQHLDPGSRDLLRRIDAALNPVAAEQSRQETARVLRDLENFRVDLAYQRGFYEGRRSRRRWRIGG